VAPRALTLSLLEAEHLLKDSQCSQRHSAAAGTPPADGRSREIAPPLIFDAERSGRG